MFNGLPAPSKSRGATDQVRRQGQLRFLTCGAVDDGKSTLIGRLLYNCDEIFDDELRSLTEDSRKRGTTGENLDLALLLDGLQAEREQGITIDVAFRYFATPRRSFIIADTPGHEQYTRNMATGASNSELAILLVDARKGVLTQTRRHSIICDLLGIRHIVLAVNKIDLVGFDQVTFGRICADYLAFAERLGFSHIVPIPLSARFGDNVTTRSKHMDWFDGPPLLEYLETVQIANDREQGPFRMAVQWVNRPNSDFRGFCGTISAGSLRRGESVVVANSGQETRVSRIVGFKGDCEFAVAGDAITLVFADDIDVSRGDVLVKPDDRAEVSNQFSANILWMSENPLFQGRTYLARIGNRLTPASVTNLKHRLDIVSLEKFASKTLELNEIGECNVQTVAKVAFDSYQENRDTGSFILIDRETNATVAAGMILHGLRRAQNVHHQGFSTGKLDRAKLKSQKPCILWFTGLSGSGKSTIANLVELHLHRRGHHTVSLDGDNLRHGLNRDLGFTPADRVENIRRAGEVARLMVDAGLIVICSFISPFRSERQMVRGLVGPDEFLEIFTDAPIDICIARDPKGLYKKAFAGEIPNFTGVSAPYEAPDSAEVILKTAESGPDTLAARVIEVLERFKIIEHR